MESYNSWWDRTNSIWYERSGTKEIIDLKQEVNKKSQAFEEASTAVTTARKTLDQQLNQWERISGQHLQLLQRKEYWNANDAAQFATLVQEELTTKHALEDAKKHLSKVEQYCTECQWEFMNAMRKRYQEEQLWQDKWRLLGTYGTWALIGLNTVIFLISQYVSQKRETNRLLAIQQMMTEQVLVLQQQLLLNQGDNDNDDSRHESKDIQSSESNDLDPVISSSLIEEQKEGKEDRKDPDPKPDPKPDPDPTEHTNVTTMDEMTGIAKLYNIITLRILGHDMKIPTWLWNPNRIQTPPDDSLSHETNSQTQPHPRLGFLKQATLMLPSRSTEYHVPSVLLGASVTSAVALFVAAVLIPKQRPRS